MIKIVYIMCGIPCSGKTTYAEFIDNIYYQRIGLGGLIISRDDIREDLYGKRYKHTKEREHRVTQTFDSILFNNLNNDYIGYILLDNTHCKEKYLDETIENLKRFNCEIKVVFFDIKLYKAYYRNIIRYIFHGKWIPFKIIKNMYINYNKINKNKYKEYIHGEYNI